MSTDDGDRKVDEFVEPRSSGEERDSFRLDDERLDAFGEPQIKYTGGHWTPNERELPQPVQENPLEDALAPPFTLENQVCIADTRAFVLRDEWGFELKRFQPGEVERTPSGRYRVLRSKLTADSEPAPAGAAGWLAQKIGQLVRELDPTAQYVEVEPVRPQCKHYVEQLEPLSPSQMASGHYKWGWMHRYCAARRNVAGAFMELQDGEMKACSLREPYDVETGALLRRYDEHMLEKSTNREFYPLFQQAAQSVLGQSQESP